MKEFDEFMLFYPGGIEGAFKHVDRLNEIASGREPSSRPWSMINVFDWLGFLSILFAKTRYDCNWRDLFGSSDEEFAVMFQSLDLTGIMPPSKFEQI